jgi:hypothetical protein
MSGVELNAMDLTSLPPLVFATEDGKTGGFDKVTNLDGLIRPAGGLWTSPRTPTGSAWTDFLETPDEVGLVSVLADKYTKRFAVEVPTDARIYLINTAEHLDRLVAAYPLGPSKQLHGTAPDWGPSPRTAGTRSTFLKPASRPTASGTQGYRATVVPHSPAGTVPACCG